MKRRLIGIACLAGILVGCTDQSNADQPKEITELKNQIEQIKVENDALLNTLAEEREAHEQLMNQQVNNDYAMIIAKEIETYPQTLYKKTALDIDGDDEEEIIELYVNAGKSENGLFAWDDGQKWLLVVKDGEKTYPLFDDYVQLGSIDFSMTTFDGKPGIVMLKTQHSDRTVQKFTYDKNEKGYQKETVYKKENMQNHYNHPASYGFFEDAYNLMEMAFTTKTLVALEASETTLQDSQERMTIIEPILVDVLNAQGLLGIVGELNQELNVSLDGAIDLLNQMVNKPPTAEQLNQLTSIHSVFKEMVTSDLISEKDNQMHPEVKEKLQGLDFILNE
ncbi:hypothetical protein [Sporosarcina sp. FSL K6-2383]|uniref:hypothetical protein n=1 Tax=Sporosarcina sp. FSL K6-2383 TaxID=2921556 RepID=UPI003159E3F4